MAIVDLACLNPYWGKGLDANRSISARHVDSLVKELSKTDRRYDPANRCQASVSAEVVKHILESLTVEEVEKSRNQSACQPADLPVLDLKDLFRDFDHFPNLRLEAGQHRRAAVLKMANLPIISTTGVFRKDRLHLNNQVSCRTRS